MAPWPRDKPLNSDQRPMPIVWFRSPRVEQVWFEVTDDDLEPAFGKGKSRKIKSWGHDEPGQGVHWLSTRAGTPLHIDPVYDRYTHHLIIRNDGFRIRGIVDGEPHPPMVPGSVYCLDTHSPHEVVTDDRLPQVDSRYKVQLTIDSPEPLGFIDVIQAFTPWLRNSNRHPKLSAAEATLTAPRPK